MRDVGFVRLRNFFHYKAEYPPASRITDQYMEISHNSALTEL
jgi:hypothetical protein